MCHLDDVFYPFYLFNNIYSSKHTKIVLLFFTPESMIEKLEQQAALKLA